MDAVLLSRIIGLVVFGIIGIFSGIPIHKFLLTFWSTYPLSNGVTMAIVIVILAALGFLITPWITIKPLQALKKAFRHSAPQVLISGLVGLIVGLIIAAIIAFPLSLLPSPMGSLLPVLGLFLFGYLGLS